MSYHLLTRAPNFSSTRSETRYSYLKHIPDLAHASQEQLIDAFKVYDLPKQHRRMVALFKGLCRQAGLTVGETEMPDTDLANEQDSEIDTITLQETPTPDTLQPDTLQEVEGNSLMVEPPSNSQMNGSLLAPNYSEAEEIGKFLMSLFELPKQPGWTEEDRTWWRLAVSSKAEKIAQLTKEHGGMKP